MRLNFRFKSIFLLLISFFISSCKSNDYDYLNYQIENKLASPINVRFVGESYFAKSINVTINSNETKDVLVGATGFDGAYYFNSYDSAFVFVNDIKYTYTKKDTVGLLEFSSYKSMGSSKKNGEIHYIRKLIVDENFLLNSNK